MSSHNHAKRLKKLESLPIETLTEEQKEELNMLAKMKEDMDSFEDRMEKKYGHIGFGSIHTYYDKKGNSMSLWNWSGYNNDLKYKIIRQHTYGDFFVSTVWMGIDYGFPPIPKSPIIFETMIFIENDREHELNDYQLRYSTEDAAIKGHLETCQLASSAANKDLAGKLAYLDKELNKGLEKRKED